MFIFEKISAENIKRCKKRFYWTAAVMLVLGVASLSAPLIVSFAVEALVGGLLSAVGVSEAVTAYRGFRDGDKPWQTVFMAASSLLAGIIFFTKPLAGLMTLSMLLSAYFLVEGVAKVVEYFRVSAVSGSVWLLLSGALSVLLAFMMWSNTVTGASMIGIILGVNLIFSGTAFFILGRNCSKL